MIQNSFRVPVSILYHPYHGNIVHTERISLIAYVKDPPGRSWILERDVLNHDDRWWNVVATRKEKGDGLVAGDSLRQSSINLDSVRDAIRFLINAKQVRNYPFFGPQKGFAHHFF